ncbi:MAG: ABC transporter permease [Bacteroidota bacterium]
MFLIKRIGQGILVVWGIVTVLFLIFYTLGDPVQYLIDDKAGEEEVEAMRRKYKLDRPLIVQYASYLNGLSPLGTVDPQTAQSLPHIPLIKGDSLTFALKGPDLGNSYKYDLPVREMIGSRLEGTLILALTAISFAAFLGIFLGVIAALKRETWIDRSILSFSVLGISAPSFFIGVLIAWLFAVKWRAFTGLNVSGYMFEEEIFSPGRRLVLKNLFLPALALGIRPLAVFIQLTRSSMIEVMMSDYVRTARAKGLAPLWVTLRHALRNALNPVLTSVTGWLASLLAGAFFIEYIFNWQGIGKLLIDSLTNRDLPVVMGCVLLIGLVFVLVSILTDWLYRVLDPRIKLSS